MINYEMEAIQIVKIIDGKKCRDGTKEKIVKVINGPCLEELKSDDFKDIPILVFSIAGKTRGGKSFLLNLMIKYLEFQASSNKNTTVDNWFTGSVPNCFPWRHGSKPLTKGLWIWPRVYKVKARDGNDVGILLLDNEGMFGSDATDAEIITMSGISTAISYLQMMNVKDSITGDILQNIVCYLGKGVESLEEEDDLEDDNEADHKLMFVVRDWTDVERFDYGFCYDYIEDEINNSGEDNQLKWEEVQKTFPDIQSVLLPHPGLIVNRATFSGDLSSLEEDFCRVTKTFIETLFHPSHLLPEIYNLSGEGLYEMIMKFNDKVADRSLSFMNIFTERINFFKVEALKKEFEQEIHPQMHPTHAKRLMEVIMTKAENVLMKGRSYQQHLDDLRSTLTKDVNKLVQMYVLNKYEHYINNIGTIEHNSRWVELSTLLQRSLCGEEETKMNTIHKFAQCAAKAYYSKLRKELLKCFISECEKKSLKYLAGFDNLFIKSKFKVCKEFGVLTKDQNIVYPIWLMEKDNLKEEIDKEYLKRVEVLTKENDDENEIKDWLKRVKRKQYEYFEASTLFKSDIKVNLINKNNKLLTQKKIGYALFGPPSQNKDSNLEGVMKSLFNSNKKGVLGYTNSQQEKINTIYEKVVERSKSHIVLLTCTFIIYFIKDKDVTVPLFRIHDSIGNIFFLDSNARVYETWADFSTSNTLPSVTYCYPCNGIYDKSVGFEVGFAKAPSKTISSKLIDAADTTGNFTSVAAGIAGIAAFVVSAPLVGGFAIIGGGIAGAYGLGRGCYKIYDKYKHSEKVKMGDYWNVAANGLSVFGMGAGAVAERLVTFATGVARVVMAVKAVTVICSSDETTALISLINEIAEFSLKVMFYLNANSTEEAVKIIQNGLGIEKESSKLKILETLLENNCVNSSEEVGSEIVMEKYVSQGVKDIVTGLLKTVDSKTVNIISKQLSIDETFKTNNMLNSEPFLYLYKEFEKENMYIKEKLVSYICNNEELSYTNLKADLSSGIILHLVLAARYFICSVISKVRLANNKYNNVNHKPLKLVGYDCDFHPLDEVVRLIANMIDQNQSVMNLSQYDNSIDKVLHKLIGIFSSSLRANEGSKCAKSVINTSIDILGLFDTKIESVDSYINEKEASCNDLKEIFKNIGKNINFGYEMLIEIMDEFLRDKNTQISNMNSTNVTIVPAWSGVLDRLYMYCSDAKLEDKLYLIKDFKGYSEKNYKARPLDADLSILTPCDFESFPLFVVYAPCTDKIKGECGLIWHSEEPSRPLSTA